MGTVTESLHVRADAVRAVGPAVLTAIATTAKTIGRDEAGKVTGGDGKLTGKKRRGIALGVYTDEPAQGHTVWFLTIKGRPAGPWVWVTSGTRAHTIRRRKKGPLSKLTVRHPGTRGAGAWTRVVGRTKTAVPQIFADAVHAAVRS